jgi:hypothetical protein
MRKVLILQVGDETTKPARQRTRQNVSTGVVFPGVNDPVIQQNSPLFPRGGEIESAFITPAGGPGDFFTTGQGMLSTPSFPKFRSSQAEHLEGPFGIKDREDG